MALETPTSHRNLALFDLGLRNGMLHPRLVGNAWIHLAPQRRIQNVPMPEARSAPHHPLLELLPALTNLWVHNACLP